jgi:hypothetical protein
MMRYNVVEEDRQEWEENAADEYGTGGENDSLNSGRRYGET